MSDPLHTSTACPHCGRILPAKIIDQDGDLYMISVCPDHGETRTLFWRDARLFDRLDRLRHPAVLPEGALDLTGGDGDGFVTTLAIDVTTRCNLECPTCVSRADRESIADPTVEQLLSWLPDYSGKAQRFRPNISLIGGESTMRDDLPEIIVGIRKKGLVPRMNTNGLLLLDPKRQDALWEAGLRWIILQFDGFESRASEHFRGRDYSKIKLQIIEALARKGFALHLAVMVQKGINDHEVGRILAFAAGHPKILRVSLYPKARIGRFDDPPETITHAADVLEAIEKGTAGQVTVSDILDSKQVGRWMFRLTRHPMFRQRVCIMPFMLLRKNGRLLSVSRLFRPSGLLENMGSAWQLLRSFNTLMNFDQALQGPDFLMVNIEKFYDRQALDLHEARNCHHVYVTSKGAFPFCIYNNLYRETGKDAPSSSCTGAPGA